MIIYFVILQLCLSIPQVERVHGDIYKDVLDKLYEDWSDPRVPKGALKESPIKDDPDVEDLGQTIHKKQKTESEKGEVSSTKENPDEEHLRQTIHELKIKLENLNKINREESFVKEKTIREFKTKLENLNKINEEREDELDNCQSKLQQAGKESASGLVYFKHFIKIFASHFEPLDLDVNKLGVKALMNKERYNVLKKMLSEDASPKELLDFLDEHGEFQSLDPTKNVLADFLVSIDSTVILFVTIGVIFVFLAAFLMKQLLIYGVNWRKLVVMILFIGFLTSIPWEWYRMYRVALSKKASNAMKEIPIECNPQDLSVWKSVSLYFKSTFTFNIDNCAKYHEDILVDPFWEVSPLQATSVCLSRFFFEPMKYFSSAIGESFRLLFQEIPLQWQPIIFLAIFFCIITVIISIFGLKIRTPLIDINVNPAPEIQYVQKHEPIAINNAPVLPQITDMAACEVNPQINAAEQNLPQITEKASGEVNTQIKSAERNQFSTQTIPSSIQSIQFQQIEQIEQIGSIGHYQKDNNLRRRKPHSEDDLRVDNVGMSYVEASSSHTTSDSSRIPYTQNEQTEPAIAASEITNDFNRMSLVQSKPINELQALLESDPPSRQLDQTDMIMPPIPYKIPSEHECSSTTPSQRSQRMEVQEVVSSIKVMLGDRSSGNLVPDFSSVFDIPISSRGGSISGESDINFQSNSSVIPTVETVETMGAERQLQIDDEEDGDFLLIDNN